MGLSPRPEHPSGLQELWILEVLGSWCVRPRIDSPSEFGVGGALVQGRLDLELGDWLVRPRQLCMRPQHFRPRED